MGFFTKLGLIVVVLLAFLYLAILGIALSLKSTVTFIPTRDFVQGDPFDNKEELLINGLHAWYIPTADSPADADVYAKTVLFAHGNGGNVSFYNGIVSFFHELGCNVLIFDYPGFGRSQGTPTETNCYAAGLVFYNELVNGPKKVKPSNIILAGMSLGGAIASRLAVTVPDKVHALILISTFVSPRKLVCGLFKPLWLWSYVANEFFLNEDLKKLAAKDASFSAQRCLVLHSEQDGLIGFDQAEENCLTLRCGSPVKILGLHQDPRFPDGAIKAVTKLISRLEESV
jgi:hypothetical protein